MITIEWYNLLIIDVVGFIYLQIVLLGVITHKDEIDRYEGWIKIVPAIIVFFYCLFFIHVFVFLWELLATTNLAYIGYYIRTIWRTRSQKSFEKFKGNKTDEHFTEYFTNVIKGLDLSTWVGRLEKRRFEMILRKLNKYKNEV